MLSKKVRTCIVVNYGKNLVMILLRRFHKEFNVSQTCKKTLLPKCFDESGQLWLLDASLKLLKDKSKVDCHISIKHLCRKQVYSRQKKNLQNLD